MKQVYFILIMVWAAMSGCGGKKGKSVAMEQLMFQIDSVDQVTGVQRMQVLRAEQTIVSDGRKYRLFIERTPSDSLPTVKNDLGIFADNRIVVRITREDGTQVFAKTFTKHVFADFLSVEHLRHFILEGVVFDEEKTNTGKNIVLAASVSHPQTDLYMPFSVTVTAEGKMSIVQNEELDTLPPLEDDVKEE